MEQENPAIKEVKCALEDSERKYKETQQSHKKHMNQLKSRIDELRLQERPQYPTADMIAGIDRIRNMTLEEYDNISYLLSGVEFSPHMKFIPFGARETGNPQVELLAGAPTSEVNSLKLWWFNSQDANRIISEFRSRDIKVLEVRFSLDKQSILLEIHTPWFL